MTQTAAEALKAFKVINRGSYEDKPLEIVFNGFLYQDEVDAIERSLRIAAMIDSGELVKPLTSYWTRERDAAVIWNDLLEKLRAVK